MKRSGAQSGEIVQVEGGHILRATGRKDRHSKVYTAKGPRDRRVRLAAHTAIQFYDVQDRLGYDRPSKAVDWLIKKAQTAIEKLNEVAPPWQPGGCSHTPTPDSNPSSSDLALDHHQSEDACGYANHSNNNNNNNSSSFLESFFPTGNFAGFAHDPSCHTSSFQGDDLGLSLQTFHSDNHGNSTLPFQEGFQRIDGWNSGGDHMGSRVGVLLNSQHSIFPFAHRELLQSSAALNPWLIPTNHLEPRSSKSSNFESPFELGFRVPARIYGEEEEAENHR